MMFHSPKSLKWRLLVSVVFFAIVPILILTTMQQFNTTVLIFVLLCFLTCGYQILRFVRIYKYQKELEELYEDDENNFEDDLEDEDYEDEE